MLVHPSKNSCNFFLLIALLPWKISFVFFQICPGVFEKTFNAPNQATYTLARNPWCAEAHPTFIFQSCLWIIILPWKKKVIFPGMSQVLQGQNHGCRNNGALKDSLHFVTRQGPKFFWAIKCDNSRPDSNGVPPVRKYLSYFLYHFITIK